MDLDYMQTLTLDTQVKAASSSIYFLKRVTSDKLEAQSGAAEAVLPKRTTLGPLTWLRDHGDFTACTGAWYMAALIT